MVSPIKLPERINQAQYGNAEVYKSPQNEQPTDKSTAMGLFDQEKQKRESEVYGHESLHKMFAGSQGGPIVIDRDTNGVAQSGHVDIQMPSDVNQAKPGESYQMAETAYKSATAPGGDMSSADKSVASRAQGIMSQSSSLMGGNSASPSQGKKLSVIG